MREGGGGTLLTFSPFSSIVSRVRFKGLGAKIGKGNFNIPKSILDLIYTQSLLWCVSVDIAPQAGELGGTCGVHRQREIIKTL